MEPGRVVDDHKECVEAQIEPWRTKVYIPVVADSHHFMRNRIRIRNEVKIGSGNTLSEK
jgi:hypothetical protein